MSVAGNPAKNIVSINNPGKTFIEQMIISDVTGRKLLVQQLRSANTMLNIDIRKLQTGHYFISVFADGKYSVLPFLKQP
ncbi:T9SS type A sorting domain-containing protein [Flavitalea antarctica]